MTTVRVFRGSQQSPRQHAHGIKTAALVTPVDGEGWLCGISVYAPGTAAPPHSHNCGEQIVILEGSAELCVGDQRWTLHGHDSGWIGAGLEHSYRNIGEGDLRLLWLYDRPDAMRTSGASGQTVPLINLEEILAPKREVP